MNKGIEAETHSGYRDIKDVPSEYVPFYLLAKRVREVLQHTADGHSIEETGKLMGVSRGTIDAYRHIIAGIAIKGAIGGTFDNDYPNQTQITILALIQDGITYGYLTHKLPEEPIQPLTPSETKILDLTSQGKIKAEIAKELYFSPHIIDAQMVSIHKKLHTRNIYQAVARATYLRIHNMWPSTTES